METKICSTCKRELPINMFSKHKSEKDGLRGQCKDCTSIYKKKWSEKNKNYISDYSKKYWENNKIELSNKKKEYRAENIEKCRFQSREYMRKNKEKVYAQHKIYIANNKEKIAAQKSIYHANNKEKFRDNNRKWKINNAERYREYMIKFRSDPQNIKRARELSRIYNKTHPEYSRSHSRRYHSLKRALPSTLTQKQWEKTVHYFENKCCYCGKELPLEQEHFIAISKMGEYTHNNIIPACKSCNCSKGDRDFFDWYPKYRHYSKKREKKILEFLEYKNGVQQLKLG